MKRRVPWLSALALLAGACSFAPHYSRPSTEEPPPQYREMAGWKAAQPADARTRGPWWEIFGDARLNELEARVTSANQNIKAAFARLQEARAQTRIARSYLFPTVTIDPSATRGRTSVNSPTYVNTKPATGNDFVLDADVSYELDLWGRIRNSVAAAKATEQASVADLATLDLSTHAELASDYFTLRSEDRQQELLDATAADYRDALELTQHLYDGGAAALADLDEARAQLQTALTQAADMRLRRAQTEHAIAVLLGASASSFHLDPQPLAPDVAPPAIEPGLPSALLERRPDVAAAERRVAAANAQIGVARAAYFPVFSLAGVAGFESTSTSNWITAPSQLWSVGPSAVFTALDGGLHRAQSAQAHAAYDEQVADYRGTVLSAYQDVEDNIAALRQLEQESITEDAAVAATSGALEQAQYRYKAGIATYLEVVVAENAALAARLSAADIQVRRMTASVQLVKALGGGWYAGSP
ncbi:MAG TPA: efflux transporter outer membrane subunit [Steroidobacteraceae bacterium]|nr:efflux transporter outer membrane subunit [Steroidobacteraceae bacterium]